MKEISKPDVMRLPALAIIAKARPGDTVEYLAYNGMGRFGAEYKPARGRVVMARPSGSPHLVLNIGGRYGTPKVVDERNLVSLKVAGRRERWDAPMIMAGGVK